MKIHSCGKLIQSFLFFSLFVIGSSAQPFQQNTELPPATDKSFNLARGTNEFAMAAGASFDSPTLLGTARQRKLFLLELRYGRVLGGSRSVAYEYTAEVIPVALVFQPALARLTNRTEDAVVYGAGLAPIGFRFIFNRRGRIKPYAGLSGGFLYSRRPVPVDVAAATRFNFTFDFGGGVQFFTRERWALNAGYKFHHLSNAYRSRVNPGLDGNVVSVGVSFFKKP